jgi:septum formation protein
MNPMLPAGMQQNLVLASASPRRAQILEMLQFDFSVERTTVEDTADAHADPVLHATNLARLKAADAAARWPQHRCIGADTIVVIDGDVLEKPRSDAEALTMLSRLRDRWHTVHTAVAIVRHDRDLAVDAVASTEVRFNAYSDAFARSYIATGECNDKAGAYAIQGLGALLVREIRGCYFNVMGFPVTRFVELLRDLHAREVTDAR